MAWERTSFSVIAVGVLLARSARDSGLPALALVGIALTVFGGALLVRAGQRYEELRHAACSGDQIASPRVVRMVGAVAVLAPVTGLTVAIAQWWPSAS